MLDRPGQPLRVAEVPDPEPNPGQVLLDVRACGVCRTDLHVVDGELPHPKLPLVPGHQIVGVTGDGRRLGVPWLGWTDGDCRYCVRGSENLCDRARFTGYDLDGGYADRVVADERFCFSIPDGYTDEQAAPLLCAGLIGYRSLRMAGDARAPRPVRVRRVRAHRRAGRATPGPACVRVHEAGRRRGAVVRPRARRGMGGRIGRAAARGARRGDPVRPGRRARSDRARRGGEGRHASYARAST